MDYLTHSLTHHTTHSLQPAPSHSLTYHLSQSPFHSLTIACTISLIHDLTNLRSHNLTHAPSHLLTISSNHVLTDLLTHWIPTSLTQSLILFTYIVSDRLLNGESQVVCIGSVPNCQKCVGSPRLFQQPPSYLK